MKVFVRFVLLLLCAGALLGNLSCESLQLGGRAEVVVYPAPGDLSRVEGLQESLVFDVAINGQDAFVYHGSDPNHAPGHGYIKMSEKGVSYVNFAFARTMVTVVISTPQVIQAWNVKPSVETAVQRDAHTLEVVLDRAQKFLVSTNLAETGEEFLIVSAELPERDVPAPGDPGVLYLGPGVHRFGQAWDPFAGDTKTVYLAGGAVVQATINTVGRRDIAIRGRGLFTQAFVLHGKKRGGSYEWVAAWMGLYLRDCHNVDIKGIAVLNSPSYQLEVANCEDVTIENVKLCGHGEVNNDGLHVYSRRVLVEDCFISGNDDRICVTGLYDSGTVPTGPDAQAKDQLIDTWVEDVVIRDTVFWGVRNGGDIMLTWNGGQQARDVLVENCDSLTPTNKGFVAAKHGGDGLIQDVTFRNCRLYHGNLIDVEIKEASCWGKGGGRIADLIFEDITLDVPPGQVQRKMVAHSPTSNLTHVTFNNVQAQGELVTDIGYTQLKINPYTSNIFFNQPHLMIVTPIAGRWIKLGDTVEVRAQVVSGASVKDIVYYANEEKLPRSWLSPSGKAVFKAEQPGTYTLQAQAKWEGWTIKSSPVVVEVVAE